MSALVAETGASQFREKMLDLLWTPRVIWELNGALNESTKTFLGEKMAALLVLLLRIYR